MASQYQAVVDSLVSTFERNVAAKAGILQVFGPILLILFTIWLANSLYYSLPGRSRRAGVTVSSGDGSKEDNEDGAGKEHAPRSPASLDKRRVRTSGNAFQPRASYMDTHGTLLASWHSPRGALNEVNRVLHSCSGQTAHEDTGSDVPANTGGDKMTGLRPDLAPPLIDLNIRAPSEKATPVSESGVSLLPSRLSNAPAVPASYSAEGWFNLVIVIAGFYIGTSLVHSRMEFGSWLAGRAMAMVSTLAKVPELLRDVGVTAGFYILFAHTHATMVTRGMVASGGWASYALQALAETGMLGGLILYARSQAGSWPFLARLALLLEATVLTMKLHSHISVNRELAKARQVLVQAVVEEEAMAAGEIVPHYVPGQVQPGHDGEEKTESEGERERERDVPEPPSPPGITPRSLAAASRTAAAGLSWLTANLRRDAGTDKLDASLGLASPVRTPAHTPDRPGGAGHKTEEEGKEGRAAGTTGAGKFSFRLPLERLQKAWSSSNLPAPRETGLGERLPLALALAKFPYPANVTLTDLAVFTLAPTLVYEPVAACFPRTAGIRMLYVAEKVTVAGALVFAGILIFSNTMQPALSEVAAIGRNIAAGKDVDEGRVLIDAVAHIALPTVGLMLISFYVTFECVCNACAELSQFGDRWFYDDWWNSTTFAEFSRKWNKPVHEFLLRHVYLSFMGIHASRVLLEGRWADQVLRARNVLTARDGASTDSAGAGTGEKSARRKRRPTRLSPQTALYLTFAVSIAVHEAILWGALGWVTPWLAIFSCMQFPLLTLLRLPLFRGKRLGNIVFWSGLIIGISIIITLYAREYAEGNA